MIPDLALKLAQLAHLGAELNGAADGKHGVGEINTGDERGKRHDHRAAEAEDVRPQPRVNDVAQQHAGEAEAGGVEQAHAAVDLELIVRVVPPAHVEELFHHPAGEVFQRAREQRTEQKGQKRVAEAAAQGVEHEQRAVTVDGAEKAVEEAALFAQAPLGHGAVDHFAAPAERAVGDEEQEKGAEVLKGLRQRQGGQGGHGQYLLYI